MTSADPRIVMLRHGETEWSSAGRHTGSTDVPLTPLGKAQARAAGDMLRALGLRDPLVISSPRDRARSTARGAGFEIDRVWDALAEWDYGDYEGLTSTQIRRSVPGWTVWTHPCPGGESHDAVTARADMVLDLAAAQLAERDVILVGHGHFSRALTARWVELPVTEGRRFALFPAGLVVLGHEHGIQQIVSHNVLPRIDMPQTGGLG